MSLTKILIANRGEIAIRIMHACREMNIASVVVYSDADRHALHTALSDEAVLIGPAPAAESYLNIERVIAAAQQTHCDAIHPGYGFLAENADFAQAVVDAGLTFIGPSATAIRAMGSKTSARTLMQSARVPVVPGFQPKEIEKAGIPGTPLSVAIGALDESNFADAAQRLGFPVMVKAAAGGGGKGMRVVSNADVLAEALESARREALNAFGDPSVYLEKLLVAPHHIEFQVLADQHGNIVHLLERECSVQRRHQKIIEETPSPLMTPELRARMGAAAVEAARAAGYTNAGTIEFLVDADRNFYFLEMNTRLQVEHPVTEAVTGIDLVKAQIRVAAGEPLPFTQGEIRARGHAIECRVYAEDPASGFLPSTGKVLLAEEPRAPGVRVDAGVGTGREVTRFYDPMIAKVIASAETRADAIERMDAALANYAVLGVTTNIRFLRDVLAHDTFRRGDTATDFVDQTFANWSPPAELPGEMIIATALSESAERSTIQSDTLDGDPYNPWKANNAFRLTSKR